MVFIPEFYLFLVLTLSFIAHGVPIQVGHTTELKRENVLPIIYPAGGETWTVGAQQRVSWDSSSFGAQNSNLTGTIILGWLDSNGADHQFNSPLAQNFSLNAGSTSIRVPNVPDRTSYIIYLIGTSFNITRPFTITGGLFGRAAAASSSSASSSILASSTQSGPSTAYLSSSLVGPSTAYLTSSGPSTAYLSTSSNSGGPLTIYPNSSTTPLPSSSSSAPAPGANSSAASSFLLSHNLLSFLAIPLTAFVLS